LWAGDPWVVDKRNGCAVRLPKGTYRVQVKGMDFKGHRRTARVRAFLKGSGKPALGEACGRTGTDCGWVSLFDLGAYKKAVTVKRAAEYESDLTQITKSDGIGVMRLDYGGKSFEMALQPSGLGDGTFTVYPLQVKGKTVGMEVEFLPSGFKLEKEIPGVGGRGKEKQAKPDKESRRRARELMKACEKGKVDVVKRLLKEDPGLVNARGGMGFLESISPLQTAAMFGHAEVAEVLLKAGHAVDAVDEEGNTPLMEAAGRGKVDVVRMLLAHKADVNARKWDKGTALHETASVPMIGKAEVVRLLLVAGADTTAKNDRRLTPLAEAREWADRGDDDVRADHDEVIELLKAHGKKK
jgi:hypothetical protein